MKKSIYFMVISGLMASVMVNGMFVPRRWVAAGAGGRPTSSTYGYGGRYGQSQQRAEYGKKSTYEAAIHTRQTPQDESLLNRKMTEIEIYMDFLKEKSISRAERLFELQLARQTRGPLENLKAFWPESRERWALLQQKREISKLTRKNIAQYKDLWKQRDDLWRQRSEE